jgi:multisubunit Na+/H+ antiporter MnhC subunit
VIPKLKLELLNNYMFLGWLFVFAGLMGGLYVFTGPGVQETILGFAMASLVCGLFLIYLGYTKKTVFKKKK